MVCKWVENLLKMGYIWGYNLLTTLLLTSWDIQVFDHLNDPRLATWWDTLHISRPRCFENIPCYDYHILMTFAVSTKRIPDISMDSMLVKFIIWFIARFFFWGFCSNGDYLRRGLAGKPWQFSSDCRMHVEERQGDHIVLGQFFTISRQHLWKRLFFAFYKKSG